MNDKIREVFERKTIIPSTVVFLDGEYFSKDGDCMADEIQVYYEAFVLGYKSAMQAAQEEIERLKKEKEYSHVLVEFSETEDSKSTEVNISGYYDESKSETHQLIVKLVHAEIRKIVGKIWEVKK